MKQTVLMLEDLVIVVKGKHKIGNRWKHDPYVVISQANNDMPVYDVRRDNSRAKKTRLLNRTLLLPFVGLPRLDEEDFEKDHDGMVVLRYDQHEHGVSQADPWGPRLQEHSEGFVV